MNVRDKAIWDTICHWHRMTDWVRCHIWHNFNHHNVRYLMVQYLDEDFYGDYCPLCQRYVSLEAQLCMSTCPLLIHMRTVCGNSESLWYKIRESKSQKEWVERSNVLLDVLYDLLPYDITTA